MNAVKAEKASAIRRYRRLRQIATLFRCVEAFAALALLSWLSSLLPLALRLSAAFLRQLSAVLFSPRFVFLLGNAIVLTLFFKSRPLSSSSSPSATSDSDLYDEILKNASPTAISLPAISTEDVVYEDKAVCVEESMRFRRSASEKIPLPEKPPLLLRRSETDVCKNVNLQPPAVAVEDEREAEMSNEEFRQTIEAFIAKQLRFQREESLGGTLTVCD